MQPTYDCVCLGDVIEDHRSCGLVLVHGVSSAGGGLDQNLGEGRGERERERERERQRERERVNGITYATAAT